MSAIAGVQRPGPPSPTRAAAGEWVRVPPIVLQLAAFAGLAGFCLAHYARLVAPTPGARTVGLVAVATAAGAALAASARLPRAAGIAARIATLVVLVVASLAVTGLAPKFLAPGHWSDLNDGLNRGFAGLDTFQWPYDGAEPWVRLTIVLAMPLLLVPATALAFWPARRFSAAMRTLAIVPLMLAYGMGVTNLDLSAWALRGTVLLLLIAAYLWLPRVRGRDAGRAVLAVLACAFIALPLAAGLDARQPWLDYRNWDWFSKPQSGTAFGWDHQYGPITWSRSGIKLLEVRSPEPHYWKAETLDRFDGLRWLHSESSFGAGTAQQDIPQPIPRRWDEQMTVTVRRLKTDVVVGAGTIYRTDGGGDTSDEADGTVRVIDTPLHEGDTYKVYAYVPDPTAAQMRAAPRGYPERLAEYTYFDLPAADQSGLNRPDLSAAARSQLVSPRTILPPIAGAPISAADAQRVLASPYARIWKLAHTLAAGQPTTYDVVKSMDSYLKRDFTYSEKPPARRYPLSAFLFQDKLGYCQQFSGAMALMLRMDGIPTRVATGFSPGAFNHTTKEYEVRDYDAHSWVEVWFEGIGWVPFDPTPSLAPAGSQSTSSNAASAARGGPGDASGLNAATKREVASGGGAGAADQGSHLWPFVLGFGVLGAAGLGALWLMGFLRARPHFAASAEGAVQELRAALDRLGYSYPPRTTLSELERRLRVTGGEPAARYVGILRTLRYAPPGAAKPPGQRDRRALRRALTAGGGPFARLRGLLVLPPHPRRRAF